MRATVNGTSTKLAAAFAVALLFALALPAKAERPAASGAAAGPSANLHRTAPVVIDGKAIFRLRGATALPAAVRAANVVRRIKAIAADPSIDPDSLTIVRHPLQRVITSGERNIVAITEADAQSEGVQIDLLARITRTQIVGAVKQYRLERSPEVLRYRAIHGASALAVAIVLILGFLFVSRRLLRVLERRYKRKIKEVKIQSFRLIRADQIFAVWNGVVRFLRIAVVLALSVVTVTYVLGLFPWTRHVANKTVEYLVQPLEFILAAILDNIPNLIFLAILFLIARFVLHLIHMFFRAVDRGVVRFAQFEPQWAIPTYKIVRLAVIAFALVLAYPYIPGSESAAFKGVSIFAGVVLSLGSTSIIANIVAGYTAMYRRAYEVGDWIRIGETAGQVVERRLLVTRIKSWKNEAIAVPNSRIINMEIVNFTELAKESGLILHANVGIGYEVPWRRVEALLIEAANRTEGLDPKHAPFVFQKALGDFAVTYELNAYCNDPSHMPALYSELHRNILDVFNEAGVQIMTPSYVADPAQPKIAPIDDTHLVKPDRAAELKAGE